jgi:hypothetical protein
LVLALLALGWVLLQQLRRRRQLLLLLVVVLGVGGALGNKGIRGRQGGTRRYGVSDL